MTRDPKLTASYVAIVLDRLRSGRVDEDELHELVRGDRKLLDAVVRRIERRSDVARSWTYVMSEERGRKTPRPDKYLRGGTAVGAKVMFRDVEDRRRFFADVRAVVEKGKPVTTTEILGRLGRGSPNQVVYVLKGMRNAGEVKRTGRARATRWTRVKTRR